MVHRSETTVIRVSIIIPCLNESKQILSTLKAIREGLLQSAALRPAELETILVDGGSLDDTVNLSRPLVDKLIYCSAGRSRQMNAGAEIAEGSLLLFLHADTLLPSNFLECLFEDFLLSCAAWGRFDIRLDSPKPVFRMIEVFINGRSRFSSIATGDQALFITKAAFNNVGCFDDILLMEDVAMCKKLNELSKPFNSRLKVISSSRRWEKQGPIKVILQMWMIRFAYFVGVSPKRLHAWYYLSKQGSVS